MDWKKWFNAAAIRALRTFIEILGSTITVGAAISDIDWKNAFSVAIVGAIYTFLVATAAGLPEIDNKE